MPESPSIPANRRQLLAALGGGGLALALASASRGASAQDAPDYSDHPLTGMWLAMANPALPETPPFAAPSFFGPDGTVFLIFPPVDIGPEGVFFQSSPAGVWEPYDDRTGHFTVVTNSLSPDGLVTGSTTIDGYPSVQDDNDTFVDRNDLSHVTIRDAAGAVIVAPPPDPTGRAVTAIRMSPGNAGFPSSDSATPEATPAT